MNFKRLIPESCQSHPSLTFTHFETLTPVSSHSLGCHRNEEAQNYRLIFNLQFEAHYSIFNGDDVPKKPTTAAGCLALQ